MPDQTPWERETIEKLLFETLKEQRRQRRWKIFFRLFFIFILLMIFYTIWHASANNKSALNQTKKHTAVIDIHGTIEARGRASAADVIDALQQAYDEKNVQGIILQINSPGGSAVQASLIFNEIMRQRTLHKDIPLYAVCEDFCASAAYYIAAASQTIYANPASLVGSIGAMINGFGATAAMEKIGVERRLITAGSDKGFLDPFSPLKKTDEAYAQRMLDEVHQQFIHDVKLGRGDRLKVTEAIFSGKPWTGIGAKPLGIIDEFGSVEFVAREIIKNKNIVYYNGGNAFLDQLSEQFSTSLKQVIHSALFTGIAS